ncbi:tautomerase family protein [Geomonas sp. RF6]|uniref:4-oxalocrotonate tautomerase DmpI n=1 Tax=Geomonas sp. RF6 TaxID=2897342 RepID=UPI001E3D60A9|nr:4-oxalocrotonate tautomerase DmpI [Geomonas sp. RF6]UFS70065.1 tautomerase family protein [Geomonas sp. RF6]
MPVITVDIGMLDSSEKKAELVKSLTSAASAATKIPEEKFIVLIKELERDNIGVGGTQLSALMKK